MASTSEKGNCSECGKPWVRVVETMYQPVKYPGGKETPIAAPIYRGGPKCDGNEPQSWEYGRARRIDKTLGWQSQCKYDVPTVPATVLDPFSGSGTTGMVAKQLGRKAILIDTSGKYCELARKRIEQVPIPMELYA